MEMVAAKPSERQRNIVGRRSLKKDRNKLLADQLVGIEAIVNAVNLPNDSLALVRLFSMLDSAEVCFGAYHQYKIRFSYLTFHTEWPPLRSRALILVDNCVNFIGLGPYPIAQSQHARLMLS